MKRLFVDLFILFALLWCVGGCASPSEDYIRADEAAWKQYDDGGLLDAMIDNAEKRGAAKLSAVPPAQLEAGDISPKRADALRQLNVGRRARISHFVGLLPPKEGTK